LFAAADPLLIKIKQLSQWIIAKVWFNLQVVKVVVNSKTVTQTKNEFAN